MNSNYSKIRIHFKIYIIIVYNKYYYTTKINSKGVFAILKNFARQLLAYISILTSVGCNSWWNTLCIVVSGIRYVQLLVEYARYNRILLETPSGGRGRGKRTEIANIIWYWTG